MTETERQDFRGAALRYRGVADAQPQPDVSLAMRERKICEDAIKGVAAMLTRYAREPERIGRRVLVLEWLLQDEQNIKSESQKSLAQALGVSEGRASQLLADMEDALMEIRNGGEEIS